MHIQLNKVHTWVVDLRLDVLIVVAVTVVLLVVFSVVVNDVVGLPEVVNFVGDFVSTVLFVSLAVTSADEADVPSFEKESNPPPPTDAGFNEMLNVEPLLLLLVGVVAVVVVLW